MFGFLKSAVGMIGRKYLAMLAVVALAYFVVLR